ncbi:MAG TPA: exodeoxyribonuclease VII small subunit [Bacteroidia bacterium]|nr:exodeoxyribonuclease VII small subunit [Bacteroidia bacterium]
MEKKSKLNYENAFQELSNIVKDIEQDNTALDELSKKITRANELISFCKEKLRQTEEEYQKAIDNLEH